ncbi:mandelate racemase/muconate lactonizing enzyme family protein [Aliirhizobium smilacinae]|uniref:Mandelate racemase/muconate lactonizing enzyme family protein n=1 Tax=Aliirhizobium smilacinae TaxID=1395944 RepID=A0A5C4XJM2_9HYPH|nr:mandelate racemase/muconate lactonizing enzyme family protein [Rhizobium smilacinae]TNM63725.1 mandelate racemase/muconate lactonizing enzyme family protein [Rhizobium smilacinae]
MKITSVEPIFADIFLFVRITTDKGIVGYGECGTWGHYDAAAAAIQRFGRFLEGQDPTTIERHWNVMLRANHYTGAAINGAVSAIDMALWDIKGKALGVPVHELLGGRMRDRVRLYAWVKGRSADEFVEQALLRKEQGFTAIGHLNPLMDDADSVHYRSHASQMQAGAELVERVRKAVGLEVDICLELHRRLSVPEAITLARLVEPSLPLFYEDPVKPASIPAMARVAEKIAIPIATGERFINIQQFQELLDTRAAEYLRVSVGVCGGITAAKKIAAMAEASDALIAPHNPVGPIGLAACLQINAVIPNFAIQEYPLGTPHIDQRTGLAGEDMLVDFPKAEGGFLAIPDGPGLGVELRPGFEEKFPRRERPIQNIKMRAHFDGSVVDH